MDECGAAAEEGLKLPCEDDQVRYTDCLETDNGSRI
jgi:hypothetical protein